MRQILFIWILFLLSSNGSCQIRIGMGNSFRSWQNRMMRSYLDLNDHTTFTKSDKVSIQNRLKEDYVKTTFGPKGLDKDTCDFFLYFSNSNTSTPLITRTVTKTGDLLMWDYGTVSYNQNNLPAQITNGVVSVTSTDEFDAVTSFDISSNTFGGPLFDVSYYFPGATYFKISGNSLSGSLTIFPDDLTQLLINNNEFTGSVPDLSNLSEVRYIDLYRNYDLAGTIDTITRDNFLSYNAFEMALTELNLTEYSSYLQTFRVQDNRIPTDDLELALDNMNTFFTANAPQNNLALDFSGAWNGYIEDTATNADYQALDDIWKAEGKTLTFNCNISPGAFADGAVVFTFDDGLKTVLTTAEPLFNSYGIEGTSYVTIEWVDEPTTYGDSGMSWSEISELQSDGWIIGSHGCTHVSFNVLNSAQLHDQVYCIDTAFVNNGLLAPDHFAYPFGNYSTLSQDTIKDHFLSARIVNDETGCSLCEYYAGTTSDEYLLAAITLENSTSEDLEYYKRYIDFAYNNQVAIIFLSHAVYEDCSTAGHDNCVDTTILAALIEYAQSLSMDILTIEELYNKL